MMRLCYSFFRIRLNLFFLHNNYHCNFSPSLSNGKCVNCKPLTFQDCSILTIYELSSPMFKKRYLYHHQSPDFLIYHCLCLKTLISNYFVHYDINIFSAKNFFYPFWWWWRKCLIIFFSQKNSTHV